MIIDLSEPSTPDEYVSWFESRTDLVRMDEVVKYADALERVGREDDSYRVLREVYRHEATPDNAKRVISAQCRLGIRDSEFMGLVIEIHGDDPVFIAAKSEMDLIDGNYDLGFETCGYRWTVTKGERLLPNLRGIPWDGAQTDGLVIVCEQGIGEEYLFACNFGDVPPAMVGCDPRLIPIFRRSFPQHEFVPKDRLPDLTTPESRLIEAMDLFRVTGRRGSTEAWLKASPERSTALREQFRAAFPGKTLVGLSWSSARASLAEAKNIPPPALLPLLGRDDCVFISLQYGDAGRDLEFFKAHGHTLYAMDNIEPTNDQDGLASLIMAMDCVVTCSNAVAHLSGSLGQKTYLLAPGRRFVLWYWGKDGDLTPWYPTMEIIRAKHGWHSAVLEVTERIGRLESGRSVG